MIIEYFNESADIILSKVDNNEITLEQAEKAYDDIANKAYNEYAVEVLNAVEEGVLSPIEANIIFEMCDLMDDAEYAYEADYDLSDLSPEQRKQIEDKLNSLNDKQRKIAERELTKKYPTKAYTDKVEKRKKILKGAAVAAGIGAGAAIAGTHLYNKKAEASDIKNNTVYADSRAQHEANVKDIEGSSDAIKLYTTMLKGGKEGEKAKKQWMNLLPSVRATAKNEYENKMDAEKNRFGADIAKIRQGRIDAEGKREYNRKNRAAFRQQRKIDKGTKKLMKTNASLARADAEFNKQHRLRSLFSGNGFTDKGIEKKTKKNLKNANDEAKNLRDAASAEIYN